MSGYPQHAGHSLGGALATLAALDARRACPDATKLDISCYTFGAPRTGNHAFAREYNKAVPDTWGIINDQASPAAHGESYAVSAVDFSFASRIAVQGGTAGTTHFSSAACSHASEEVEATPVHSVTQ